MSDAEITEIREIDLQGPLGARDRDELAAIYQAVEATCPEASLFVRWRWVAPWLDVYGADLCPLALVLYGPGRVPVGVALLPRKRVTRHGVPVRQLFLGTAGEGADSVVVEFNHLLSPLRLRGAAWRAVLQHLLRRGGFDELVLCGLLQSELPLQELPPLWRFDSWRRRPSYAMDLAALRSAGETVSEALSANTRYQIHRSLRRYGGQDGLLLEEPLDPAGARPFLDELVGLHQAAWATRGEPGSFSSPRFLRFHQALLASAPESVQLLRLRDARGHTIGVLYNLLDGDTVYYYQSGLQQTLEAWQKPGLCLHFLAMEFNLNRGRSRYDFMASDARYKRSLSNSERCLVWGAVQRPFPHLWLERAAVGAARSLRPHLSKLRSYITVSRSHP